VAVTAETFHARGWWFSWFRYASEEGPLLVFGVLRLINLELETVISCILSGCFADLAPGTEETFLVFTASFDWVQRLVDYRKCISWDTVKLPLGLLVLVEYRSTCGWKCSGGPERLFDFWWYSGEIFKLDHWSLSVVSIDSWLRWDILEGEHGAASLWFNSEKIFFFYLFFNLFFYFFLRLFFVYLQADLRTRSFFLGITTIAVRSGSAVLNRSAILVDYSLELVCARAPNGLRHLYRILNKSSGAFSWCKWEMRHVYWAVESLKTVKLKVHSLLFYS